MAPSSKNESPVSMAGKLVDLGLIVTFGAYPGVASRGVWRDTLTCFFILLVLAFLDYTVTNKENHEKNRKIMNIHRIQNQLYVALVLSVTALGFVTPYFMANFTHLDLAIRELQTKTAKDWCLDFFLTVGILKFTDIMFSLGHKYYLHSKAGAFAHKLHHACKYGSCLNVLILHPIDFTFEFLAMFFLPVLLFLAFERHFLTIFFACWILFEAFRNHSCNEHLNTEHQTVHHKKTSPSFNCFPSLFVDNLSPDHKDPVTEAIQHGKTD